MDNKEKAYILSHEIAQEFDNKETVGYECAMQMAEWKDRQINLLLDAIDHAYFQTDGTYGDLSYEVSDKVKYLKSLKINKYKS